MAKKKAVVKVTGSPESIIAGTWESMVEALPHLTERQLERLIELEMAGEQRTSWLFDRIHPRLNVVRRERELNEIKKGTWEPST